MIQTIVIAQNINKILSDKDYIHKIIIESNFSVRVHYVRKGTEKNINNQDKKSQQNELLARFNNGVITIDEFTEQFKQIENTSEDIEINIEEYIYNKLGIDRNDYRIEFCAYEQEDFDDPDSYVTTIFKGDNPIVYMSRTRFNGFFDENPQKISGDIPPVITFYSYKGGMARTTTMMAYAIKKAQQGEKVFVIDCDLEAPGYLNFFNLSEHNALKQGDTNGLVEMISDIEFSKSFNPTKFEYSKYFINTYYGFYGEGNGEQENALYDDLLKKNYGDLLKKIFVMPAGNLNDTETFKASTKEDVYIPNREHYLEGLSRINLSNPNVIKHIFANLFEYLKKELNIGVVLIDSRTGFSDIIFDSIKYYSNQIVAFFNSNEQSIPGLLNLLDEYYDANNNFGLTLVNSILPSNNKESETREKRFNQVFNEYRNNLSEYEEKDEINILPLHRVANLEKIGIKGESFDTIKFIEYVLEDKNDDYVKIFRSQFDTKIFGDDEIMSETDSETAIQAKNDVKMSEEVSEQPNTIDLNYIKSLKTINLKNNILQNLKHKLANISSFAETTDMDEQLFFYRECMYDLFKQDKFLIKGYKGTGKTYLYRALEQKEILNNLKKKASEKFHDRSISDIDYIPIQVIDTDAAEPKRKSFDFRNFITPQTLTVYNFQRFWKLHTWNSILLETEYEFINNIREQSRYKEYINDIFGEASIELYKKCLLQNDLDLFVAIDEDLAKVNSELQKKDKKMFLLYDQLDTMINPMDWKYAVSPLIEYWRYYRTSYSCIMPKIFVRTDLMQRIQGTNTLRLEQENVISIEWSVNEIFNYFFKLTLVDDLSRNCLKEIMFERMPRKYDKDKARTIFPSDKKLRENLYQLANDKESSLTPFVNAFFGTKVVVGDRFLGNAYKYFKDNLCNADRNSISLRPFINTLNDNAISAELDPRNSYKPITAIISSESYANKEVRDRATREYFRDLTRDEFSEDLIKFREFLDYKDGDPYRFKSLNQSLYEQLLTNICEKYQQELKIAKTPSDLNSMLEANGIIAEKITREGKFYQFAPLYYYIWALKNSKFDETEERKNSRIGKFVSGVLANGMPANFVITVDKRYLIKYDDSKFKENQLVQFDLKSEPNKFDKNTPYNYATNLKPYTDEVDRIEG